MKKIRLGIMASGKGSNADSILRKCADGELDAVGAVIVSNNPDAMVHQVAIRYRIPSVTIERSRFEDGKSFSRALIDIFHRHDVELILLAGYMRKVPPALIRAFPRAMLNIHPALFPRHGGKGMYGLNVHKSVLACGDEYTGVTVHFVDEDYDHGPTLLQVGGIRVLPADSPETLAARVLKVEHRSYPRAVEIWIEMHKKT